MVEPRNPGTPESWPPADDDLGSRHIKGSPKSWLGSLGVGFLLILLAAFATGRLGISTIADTEVGVLVNYMNGTKEVIDTPGIQIYMPGVQEIFLFDRTSQEFKMQGEYYVDNNHAPRLTVRANDGSNFYFEELTILFELIPGDAALLLEDSGAGEGFKTNWIKAYARSILRDEFGRYSAVEAADPTQYTTASAKSRERMNVLLAPHGLRVTQVITPKPKFDKKYERAIEERKEADQEVERLKAKEEQLVEERGRRLASVLKDKEIEMQELIGTLRKGLLESEQSAIRINGEANAFAIETKLEGEGFLAQRVAEARGLEAKYTKEAEGLTSRAKALEERGEVIVREALIKKLGAIRFSFVPYSRDPSPKRLEHQQTAGDLSQMIDEKTATEDN
ncbi:MAG: hypothetical protein ACI8QC_001662 [Planctomycetota bacterium]|jgi:hypothetical protein